MPYSLDGILNDDMAASPEILAIFALLAKVSEKFEPEADDMKRWMAAHFPNPALIALMRDLTVAMFRVLDVIGRLEPVNGITISKQSKIPKGTVSKVTRRLLAQKLITSEALPNNKKEVLFRTTPLGKEVFTAHRAFDEQMERGFVRFLQNYSADEQRFLIRLLQDVVDTSFLALPQGDHADRP